MFDFEKMSVYQNTLKIIEDCAAFTEKMPRGHGNLADQLKRAAASVCLNIAEGAGEFKPQEKARFYRMALRSASEVCAIVQVAHRLRIMELENYRVLYLMLTDVSKSLTALVKSMEKRT